MFDCMNVCVYVYLFIYVCMSAYTFKLSLCCSNPCICKLLGLQMSLWNLFLYCIYWCLLCCNNIQLWMCMFACVYFSMHVHIHMCMLHTYIHTCAFLNTDAYIQTSIQYLGAYIHAYIHTSAHTHMLHRVCVCKIADADYNLSKLSWNSDTCNS